VRPHHFNCKRKNIDSRETAVGKPRQLIRQHAGTRKVKIELLKPLPPPLMAQIKSIFPDAIISKTDQHISILISHPFRKGYFSRLSSILEQIPGDNFNLHFHEPSLEDVFFNLTGEKQEVNKIESAEVHSKGN